MGMQWSKSFLMKERQPQLQKLIFHHIINKFMNSFNYFVVPNPTLLPYFFFTVPSNTSIEPQPPPSLPEISSSENLRQAASASSAVELTREDLLEAGYQKNKRVWSAEEDELLLQLVDNRGVSWRDIGTYMPERTQKMCYSRYRRLLAQARQRWVPQEERKLKNLVEERGQAWKDFTSEFPHRTWKQLRDKYTNYLRPDIKKDDWSVEEDQKILDLLSRFGTKWKTIQQEMSDRTDNQIKNRYYGRLKVLLKKKARKRPGP